MSRSRSENTILSSLAAAELIHSIDINPFICLPQGGKAVDAVTVTREGGEKG